MNVIDHFSGDYKFLSNFYYHRLRFDGEVYQTAEHAFQAAKPINRSMHIRIKQASSPGSAKHLGRQCTLRPDWDLVKVNIMKRILRAKFSDKELGEKLLATGDAELIEGNYWHDKFWGKCNGQGANNLGRLLMEIREELRSCR